MNKIELSDQLKDLFEACKVDYDILSSDNNGGYHSSKPKAPMATFKDDPVALSCSAYRRWQEVPSDRWADFDTLKVSDEDRRQALALRSYYQQRYTMQALMGQPLTEYQQKCANFLSGTPLHTDELGLLYRLPYFYAEDLGIDQVVELTTDDEKLANKRIRDDNPTGAKITPLLHILKSRKGTDTHQFWFRSEHGYALVQEVVVSNPLLPMIISMFKQPSLTVNAMVKTEHFRSIHSKRYFGRLINLELAFD